MNKLKKQYELGQINYLNVLQVQNKWINSKILELDMKTKRLINRVNLHLAIGGSLIRYLIAKKTKVKI